MSVANQSTAVASADEFCRQVVGTILDRARDRAWDLDTLATNAGMHVEDLTDLIAYPNTLYISEAVNLCHALDMDPWPTFVSIARKTEAPA